jgi:DnaK suppressor protein
MSIGTLEEARRRLQALKAALLTEGDNVIAPAPDDASGISRPDEDTQPLAEMNQVIASSRNRARTDVLLRVVTALGRLEQDPDSFGLCAECGEEIAARRLALMPYVELCVECQQARDRPSGPSGRRHLRDFR